MNGHAILDLEEFFILQLSKNVNYFFHEKPRLHPPNGT